MKEQPPIEGGIEFRNLTFRYHANDAEVLRDINLTIADGQTVAFVGRTGSGKSTLVNLIPRVIEAPEDTVFIDGVSVRDYPLAQLRSAFGYVPQETFLFSDSLAKNIAFGVDDAEPAEIEMAAEIAGLTGDVRDFPDRFDTLVGERGITLSGGQKQRTAIARAIVREPRILILDDALSSVDTYTEEKILTQLRGVMRERTHQHHRLASRLDCARRRPDLRARRRPHHRARNARRVAGARRRVCGSLRTAVAGRRVGGNLEGTRRTHEDKSKQESKLVIAHLLFLWFGDFNDCLSSWG